MNFMSINSVNSYVKGQDMENRWRMRKNSGNYKADGSKTVSEWAEEQKKKADENSDSRKKSDDRTLKAINSKLSMGSKLTPAEKNYLRAKDQAAYQRVLSIEAEQRDYEARLRRCKTKDEVNSVKMAYTAHALSTVNSVKNNPHISGDSKGELISTQQQKSAAVERVHNDFIKCGAYSSLPTRAERVKAAKKLANAERGKEKQDSKTEVTRKVKVITRDKDGKVKIAEKEKETAGKPSGARKVAARAKAEQSYEVRKVRRARRGYRASVRASDFISVVSSSHSLDTKA